MGTRPNSIYVTIACYRDHVIQSTIDDLFAKADNPRNITVGVFLQQTEHENLITNTYGNRVRVDTQLPGQIFSVCECRNRAMCLLDDEDYVLQIDSHTRFDKGWDTTLLELHKSLNDDKSILSVYLPDWWTDGKGGEIIRKRINTFAYFIFDNGGSEEAFYKYYELVPMPSNSTDAKGKSLELGWYLCGHFIFAKREFFTKIPQPDWVGFWGEEVINSLRAFTAGWNVYIPATPPLYHMNESMCVDFSRPKLWLDYPNEHNVRRHPTTNRIIDIMKNNIIGPDELFDVRPLSELYEITKCNLGELFYSWYVKKHGN